MSVLHAPRAPWIMLVVFGAAAMGLFLLTAGPDLGLIDTTRPAGEIATVTREVRMPIVIQKIETVEEKFKEEIQKEFHKPDTVPAASPVPVEQAAEERDAKPAKTQTPVQPESQLKADTAAGGNLLSHTFQPTRNRFEAIFNTDRPVSGVRHFFKSAPSIWVMDLSGTWTNRSRRVNTIEQGPIEKVIIGEHESFLRIVFRYRDANQPRPDRPPEIVEKEDGVGVVIE